MYKLFILVVALVVANTSSAGQVVYPAKGQSPEQQKQDEAGCYSWAVDNSGYNPASPPLTRRVPLASKDEVIPSSSGNRVVMAVL
jgi:hypothetical protein